MRIAQVAASLEARHGGPSVSVPGLSIGLAGIGHEVTLFAAGPAPGSTAPFARIARTFPRSFPASWGCSRDMAAALAASDAEVFHVHGAWLRPLHYAHRRAGTTGARLVISPRGMFSDWAWHHRRARKAFADRFIHPGALRAASGWHATSAGEAEEIRARGFTQPVCVAPNGVESPSPEAALAAAAYWRQACPEAFSRPTALFYSRFHPKKRVLELIDLWLETAPPEWLLLVVGIPETYSVSDLAGYVHKNLAGERVRVLDGSGRPPPYAAAALFLLPSHSENFGLVVAEALAHGLPAITTDTMPWQALRERQFGWCVPWKDFPAALKSALAEGPGRLRQRGEAAREWVVREYSWSRVAAQLAEFYARLR